MYLLTGSTACLSSIRLSDSALSGVD